MKLKVTRRQPKRFVGTDNQQCHNNTAKHVAKQSWRCAIVQGIIVGGLLGRARFHSWVLDWNGRATDVTLPCDCGNTYIGYILPLDEWQRRCRNNNCMPFVLTEEEAAKLVAMAGYPDVMHSDERFFVDGPGAV